MSKTITFNGVAYTEESVGKMSEVDLLQLRNLVAENLGVAKVKSFKDHDQARNATWKALEKWNEDGGATSGSAEATASEGKPAKPKKEKAPPKEKGPVKGAAAQTVARPTRPMFRKIQKLEKPPRVLDRWDNYTDGMTLLEVIEGENMAPTDITWYAQNGYVKLIEPTDEEFEKGVADWYARNGKENPLEAQKKAAEEKAKVKAEREAQKKAEAEAREKAKAEREAKTKAVKEAQKAAASAPKAEGNAAPQAAS